MLENTYTQRLKGHPGRLLLKNVFQHTNAYIRQYCKRITCFCALTFARMLNFKAIRSKLQTTVWSHFVTCHTDVFDALKINKPTALTKKTTGACRRSVIATLEVTYLYHLNIFIFNNFRQSKH